MSAGAVSSVCVGTMDWNARERCGLTMSCGNSAGNSVLTGVRSTWLVMV